MRIVPDSQVVFYSGVDIVPGEQHLAFDSENARNSYFSGKVAATYTNTSMVRKDGTLLIDASIITPATMFTCNYLSFVNPSWGDKRFFGFIVDVDYMNNETMVVKWTIDEFESWRFDAQYDVMTIERQHISQADAQKNPYDPSILEHRTIETLPVGKDIEKPYYEIGTGNTDGAFLGDAICDAYNLDNELGVLFCFSDLDLESLDTGYTSPNLPSEQLFNIMNTAFALYDVNFNLMSPSLFAYWKTQHPTSQMTKGLFYDNGLWSSEPLACSRIVAPITYIYMDKLNETNTQQVLGLLLSWFTHKLQTGNIIGIYPISTGMALYTQSSEETGPYYVSIPNASYQNVRNKKLDLYPFSYLRVMAPNGDTKEFKMEDFHDVQTSESNGCQCAVCCDVIDGPSMVVAPVNYKFNGISPNSSSTNANYLESIIFSQFPTLPYIISGWESQRAAIANAIIANNTVEYGYQQELEQLGLYNQYMSAFGDFADAAMSMPASGSGMSMLGMLGSAFTKGMGGVTKGAGADVYQDILKNRWAQSEDAYDVMLGKKDTAIDNNFKYARPAFAQNKYYRSNGVGFANFMDISFLDILFLRVTLNPDVLAKYDEYFDRYGYASGEIGIPRVINFMNGSTTTSEIPEWRADGTTYVKTANCTVKNVPMPVADAIAQMFNAGIRFYHPTGV